MTKIGDGGDSFVQVFFRKHQPDTGIEGLFSFPFLTPDLVKETAEKPGTQPAGNKDKKKPKPPKWPKRSPVRRGQGAQQGAAAASLRLCGR